MEKERWLPADEDHKQLGKGALNRDLKDGADLAMQRQKECLPSGRKYVHKGREVGCAG